MLFRSVATATIIGGALAFGAQTLVRDLIAGFFVIAEDQFGVGDLVDLGAAVGVVEKVSLRVTCVRDVEGRLWYLPNGQIVRVANLSQGEGSTAVDVSVSLADDLDTVGRRLEAIANSLASDPEIGPQMRGPARCIGVEELHPDHAVLRVLLSCRTSAQQAARRRFLSAVAASARIGELRRPDADAEGETESSGPFGDPAGT